MDKPININLNINFNLFNFIPNMIWNTNPGNDRKKKIDSFEELRKINDEQLKKLSQKEKETLRELFKDDSEFF